MGSISFDIERTASPKTEVLAYLSTNLSAGATIIDHSFGSGDGYSGSFSWGGVLYAAVQSPPSDGPQQIGMFVLLFSTHTAGGYRQLTVKALHEDEGPCYYEPAQRLMKQLTATDSNFAVEWRQRVNDGYKSAREGRAKAREAIGRTIRLSQPLTYAGGLGEVAELLVIDSKTWRDKGSGRLVRPPAKWWSLDFDILTEAS